MSSERLPPAIDLVIGSSPALTCLCAAAHALAMAAVVLSGLAWPIRAALILVLLVFAIWWVAARALALMPASIVRFVWRADGECEWQERKGPWHRGVLLHSVLVHPALVVLRLRDKKRRSFTLCLASDGVDAVSLRRLRMRLRVSPPLPAPAWPRRLAVALVRRLAPKRLTDRLAIYGHREVER